MEDKYVREKLKMFIATVIRPLAATVILMSFSYPASAQEKTEYNTIKWHQGKQIHVLKIMPDMVAEFKKQSAAMKSDFSKAYSNSKVAHDSSFVRIWKTNDTSIKKILKGGMLPAELEKGYSPVFRDKSGRLMALPGNVIVRMEKSMDIDDVKRWAESRGFKIIKQLSKSGNTYIIETPPGIECLNISNKINSEAGVVSVTPDWWIKMYPR